MTRSPMLPSVADEAVKVARGLWSPCHREEHRFQRQRDGSPSAVGRGNVWVSPYDYRARNVTTGFTAAARRVGDFDPTGLAQDAVLAHENDLEGALVVARNRVPIRASPVLCGLRR